MKDLCQALRAASPSPTHDGEPDLTTAPFTHWAEPDDDVGLHFDRFSDALGVWVHMQQRTPTVREAMTTFNATVADVLRAVEENYWLFLREAKNGNPLDATIEEDGE